MVALTDWKAFVHKRLLPISRDTASRHGSSRTQTGWLFEDVQQRLRAEQTIATHLTDLLHDAQPNETSQQASDAAVAVEERVDSAFISLICNLKMGDCAVLR